MDTAIAIRTMVIHDGVAYLQAGGGIVIRSRLTSTWRTPLVGRDRARGRRAGKSPNYVSSPSASSSGIASNQEAEVAANPPFSRWVLEEQNNAGMGGTLIILISRELPKCLARVPNSRATPRRRIVQKIDCRIVGPRDTRPRSRSLYRKFL